MADATVTDAIEVKRLPDDALRDVSRAHRPFPLLRAALWAVTVAVAAGFAWIVAINPNFG